MTIKHLSTTPHSLASPADAPTDVGSEHALFEALLEVRFELPELGLVYADDELANRYVIDEAPQGAQLLETGQRWRAIVTSEGHVERIIELLHA